MVQPAGKAVLISARHEGETGGRTHAAVGIGSMHRHPTRGERIERGRGDIFAPEAAEIGKAEIVGENEDDIGPGPVGRTRGSAK